MIALSKMDGGVRLITVGNTLRHVAGKSCLCKISNELPGTFLPNQMGVDIPSGSEIVVYAYKN